MKKSITTSFLILFFFAASNVHAFNNSLGETAEKSGYINSANNVSAERISLAAKIGSYLSVILSLVGAFFFILMIYGGFRYMNSRDNSGEIDKAKSIITNAIFGLIVVLFAYVITQFVAGKLGGFIG